MISFQEFEAEARAQGFDEVLQRQWPPGTRTGSHVHAFAVRGVLVAGEMWLTVGEQTRHLQPGDSFDVERGLAHAERYGDQGATSWVARRH